MKKALLAFGIIASGIVFSACSGGYTCPTYMKKNNDTNEVLVKTQATDSNIEKI